MCSHCGHVYYAKKTSITSHKRRKTNRNATICSMSVILWNYVAFFDFMSLYIVIRPTRIVLRIIYTHHRMPFVSFASGAQQKFGTLCTSPFPLCPCFWRLLVNYIVAICFMLTLMYMNTRLTKHNRNKRLSSTHTGFLPNTHWRIFYPFHFTMIWMRQLFFFFVCGVVDIDIHLIQLYW